MNALNTKGNEPSMEEILASIRRIIADDEDRVVASAAAVIQAAVPQSEPAPRYSPTAASYSMPSPAVQPEPAAAPAPQYQPPAPQTLQPAPQSFQPAPQPPQPAPPSLQPAPEVHRPAPRAAESRYELGGGIGDAFRALEETARSGPQLTVEALVVDTIRPMLREWLDLHLPGLVKDMVREEIERITRRGR